MNMLEVEGMDMFEEQDHLTNHRLGEEDINTVEVDGMDMVEEHFHPMNHRSEVEDMDTVDIGMREDRAVELEVIEREPDGVVLVMHWTGDGAARRR
jgi:hypothetical protein